MESSGTILLSCLTGEKFDLQKDHSQSNIPDTESLNPAVTEASPAHVPFTHLSINLGFKLVCIFCNLQVKLI